MRGNAREHITEPGERLHPGALAHGDEAHQHGRRLAATVAAKERPVAAADSAAPCAFSIAAKTSYFQTKQKEEEMFYPTARR
jgi:hypothetical protein